MNRTNSKKERGETRNKPRGIEMRSFPLGTIAISEGVEAIASLDEIRQAVSRHAAEDWGDVGNVDYVYNMLALIRGGPVGSRYHAKDGTVFYVITDLNRSVTFVFLLEELVEASKEVAKSHPRD